MEAPALTAPTHSTQPSGYAANAFHPDFAKGRASGELCITETAAVFNGGAKQITLPLNGLSITLGGASDRLIFFAHPQLPDISIYTADLNALRDPVLRAHPELTTAIGAAKRKRSHNRALLLAAVLAVVALPLLILLNLNGLTAIAARQVPAEWEQKLGRSAFAQYRLQHELIDDKATQAALLAVTQPLTAAIADARYPFEFHIVNDSGLNAFALPGGVVVINSGLIQRADSANELLGVLAHEISHVTQRHGVRNIISSAGIVLTAQVLIGDASGLLATLASAAPLLLNQSYSRDFERDADTHGVALMRAAQIDPSGLETFFQKVIAHEKKLQEQVGNEDAAAALKTLAQFVSTHPATEERIERIRKLTRDAHGPYRDFEPAFAHLKTQVAIAAKAVPAESEPAPAESASTPTESTQTPTQLTDKEPGDANTN